MLYLELRCNLVVALISEIGKVPFIDVVLNLQIAVYCTLILHTLHLMTLFSRWKFKLLFSVFSVMLDVEIQLLLVFTPCLRLHSGR